MADSDLTRPVVISIDPPQGWAVITNAGVVACGEAEPRRSLRVTRMRNEVTWNLLLEELWWRLRDIGLFDPALPRRAKDFSVIERPFQGGHGNIQTFMDECFSVGYFVRGVSRFSRNIWVPLPGEWRRYVGIRSGGRPALKKMALKVAHDFANEENLGEHEAEAIAMGMAAWMHFALLREDDAVARWLRSIGVDSGTILEQIQQQDLAKRRRGQDEELLYARGARVEGVDDQDLSPEGWKA